MTLAVDHLKRRVTEGVLSFPVTPFTAAGHFDAEGFASHIADLAAHRPAALVPAGGAGELFSLSADEHQALVRIAVERAGNIPVIAGAGQGLANACAMAKSAERAGAAGILLFPPYLIAPEQDGLQAYVEGVCRSVSIGVIAYSRDTGIIETDTALRLADSCPNLIAIKDGAGNFETIVSLKQRAGNRLTLINGVPTAEILAKQFLAAGVLSYSSAVFTFLPLFALRFCRAIRDGDHATTGRLLDEFYVPLAALRRRRRGYAVAIIKAGLRIVGKPAGPVRPPLVEVSESDMEQLTALIDKASELIAVRQGARRHPCALGRRSRSALCRMGSHSGDRTTRRSDRAG